LQKLASDSQRECKVPVIVAIHNLCIGAGLDFSAPCDIRYCTSDAKFTIKEVDIGMCADIGVIQHITKVCGNDSFVREMALTGRYFTAPEALKHGYVSRVFDEREQMMRSALETAELIASKSPVGISTIKESLNFSRNHKV
jgi:delta(3,5)-delta(2,4)-dienoyl-CoA isomerase